MHLSNTSRDYQRLTPQRIADCVKRLRGRSRSNITPCEVEISAPVDRDLSPQEAGALTFGPMKPGESFGPPGGDFSYQWFRVTVPELSRSSTAPEPYLRWDCDGEHILFAPDGATWAGLDVAHLDAPLPAPATTAPPTPTPTTTATATATATATNGDRSYLIEAALFQSGIWVGNARLDPRVPLRFREASLFHWDNELRDLAARLEAAYQVIRMHLEGAGYYQSDNKGFIPTPDELPPQLRRLLLLAARACDGIDLNDLSAAADHLHEMEELRVDSELFGRIAMAGHSHLDLAWLWPKHEADRKARHSLASMLRLSEQSPGFFESLTTPWHLKHLEAVDPTLVGQVYEKIRRGEWELTGGTSIETDTLLSAEIGLVRSLQRGQTLFREITGELSTVFMAPDMFGFPSTLPTLFSQAGIRAMFTTKLAWSQLNRFPHSLFRWRSPTGRELITYQSAHGYNTDVSAHILRHTMNSNVQSGIYPRAFMPFGYSDGGGGPTEDMLARMRYLSGLPGLPRTEFAGAEEFFRGAREHLDELPTYQGELYLEMHRGTYTSQHHTKAAYGRAVAAATRAEAARAYAGRGPAAVEPWDELVWHQFHDVLPGSSIHQVHNEAVRDLDAVTRDFDSDTAAVLETSAGNTPAATDGQEPSAWFWPLPVPGPVFTGDPAAGGTVVRAPGAGVFTTPARPEAPQGDGSRKTPADPAGPGDAPPTQWIAAEHTRHSPSIRNDRSTVGFNDDGVPVSMTVDGTDIGLTGAGFAVYPDNPPMYPAWEIEPFGRRLGSDLTLRSFDRRGGTEAAEAVAVFAGMDAETAADNAPAPGTADAADNAPEKLTVTYRLYPGDPDLHIHIDCRWRSGDRQLRFEVATRHNGVRAVYGEPFGAAFRDQGGQSDPAEAQWEVPGHQWAALPTPDLSGGTALIARDRHGFSARDGRLGVTLIHPSTQPDPTADQGDHAFHILLGAFRSGATPTTDLSTPQRALQIGMRPMPVASPPAPVNAEGGEPAQPGRPLAICEETGSLVWYALESAPGGIGLILRAFEAFGLSGTARITLNAGAAILQGAGPDELQVEFRDLLDRPMTPAEPGAAPRIESAPTEDRLRVRVPYVGFEHYSLWIGPKRGDTT